MVSRLTEHWALAPRGKTKLFISEGRGHESQAMFDGVFWEELNELGLLTAPNAG